MVGLQMECKLRRVTARLSETPDELMCYLAQLINVGTTAETRHRVNNLEVLESLSRVEDA